MDFRVAVREIQSTDRQCLVGLRFVLSLNELFLRYEKSARPVGRTLARVCSMRECKLVIACHQVSTRLLAGRLVLHQTRFVRTVRSIAASA